jgi:hypothetical protein
VVWNLFLQRPLTSWIGGSHSGDYEEIGLLGCNAVWFGESPTFRKNISPHLQGQRVSQARNYENPAASSDFFLIFDPEDGGGMFLRNFWAVSEVYGVTTQNIIPFNILTLFS